MRAIRFIAFFLLLLTVFISCNKDLNVNADWKDVTVVYGLLDQKADTTFIKITKAFLGPGDAMQFAKIPDSSNYPDKLEVRLDEYQDSSFIRSLPLDTVTIHNKLAGDSIFYFPDQLMYFTTASLNENYIYKIFIKNKKTGKEITSQTNLVHDFEILRPVTQASFPAPPESFEVKWQQAKEGKRYQLLIRFFYNEYMVVAPKIGIKKSIDWIVFNDIKSPDNPSTQPFDLYFPSDAFYSVVGSKIDTSSLVDHRTALYCDFIFSVAAADMNTYMEVTEPSLSLVQEKPTFTNITNGIGLFSSRFNKQQLDTLWVSQITKDQLKVNYHTSDLGF
ncbi:MAG: hypothetical protein NT004_18895 [Bacteroidetes bacterium]|nr:hypothetical protein [Bacteroidota bacterium]